MSVSGRVASTPGAEDVLEIAAESDVPNNFLDRAELVTTLDESVDTIGEPVAEHDESGGVLLWEAPY